MPALMVIPTEIRQHIIYLFIFHYTVDWAEERLAPLLSEKCTPLLQPYAVIENYPMFWWTMSYLRMVCRRIREECDVVLTVHGFTLTISGKSSLWGARWPFVEKQIFGIEPKQLPLYACAQASHLILYNGGLGSFHRRGLDDLRPVLDSEMGILKDLGLVIPRLRTLAFNPKAFVFDRGCSVLGYPGVWWTSRSIDQMIKMICMFDGLEELILFGEFTIPNLSPVLQGIEGLNW
ncbi:MAG: hypothetical protein M1820_001103 [Bogoriella megaspora]|nr:MAG: hypothetical protein M1820_001103 [Bogoriella megaspora]